MTANSPTCYMCDRKVLNKDHKIHHVNMNGRVTYVFCSQDCKDEYGHWSAESDQYAEV